MFQRLFAPLLACTLPGLAVGGGEADALELDLAKSFKSVTGGATAAFTSNGLDVAYVAWDGTDRTKWAGPIFTLPKDCSGYDDLVVTFENVFGCADEMSAKFTDRNGRAAAYPAPCDLYNIGDCTFGLQHPDRYDAANLKQLHLYVARSRSPGTYRIRRIRLVADPARRFRLSAAGRARTAALREEWRRESSRRHPSAGFALAWIDDYGKVRPVGDSLDAVTLGFDEVRVRLARNEREGVQLLVLAPDGQALRNVRATSGRFRSPTGAELPGPEVAPVGRVTVRHTRGTADGKGDHFDPICSFTNAVDTVSNGWIQVFHVRFSAKSGQPSGIYRGKIRVEGDGCGRAEIEAVVAVSEVTLPTVPSLKTATSAYRSKLMNGHEADFRRYILREYRLNPFSIYSEAAYGTPVLPAIAEYVEARKDGLNFLPIIYLKLPRQALHSRMGSRYSGYAESGRGIRPQESKRLWEELPAEAKRTYDATHKAMYLEILRKRIPELKAAGLWDIAACYGFDEAVFTEWPAMKDLTDTLRAEFPDLKIVSTLYDHSFGLRDENLAASIIDGWIPGIGSYRYGLAEEARTRGREVWYYTTQMTIDRDSLSDIRAQLGLGAFALKVDGWLVWTVSRWPGARAPIVSSGATGWDPESFPGSNGGGSYFCMGPNGRPLATLRAEAIRDGIEDHAILSLVKELGTEESRAFVESLGHDERHVWTAAEQRRVRIAAFRLLEKRRE